MSLWKSTLTAVLTLMIGGAAKAQLTLADNIPAAALVQDLVGKGITVTNPVLTCAAGASGTFSIAGTNPLGISKGIVLTTGKVISDPATFVQGVDGPQVTTFASGCNQPAVDAIPELTVLAGNPTHDACKLEFDFVPDGDSLVFNYAFGSEEYDAYSCTGFNDVFAFFLSGPLITGAPNIALIPGTNIPVTINSTTDPAITMPGSLTACTAMGPGSPFAQYYNDNSAGTMISYYGLTKVLTARAKVIPCTTYHIVLAIADAGDCILDSGVFLEANSFSSNNVKLSISNHLGVNYPYLVEGCGVSTITATRPKALTYAQTIHLSYGGTATRGADYFNMPDSLTIQPGDTTAFAVLAPVQDNIREPDETIIVRVLNPCTLMPIDSIEVLVKDYLPFTLIGDTAICQYDSVQLIADGNTPDDSEWVWNWRSTPQYLGIVNQGRERAIAKIDTSTTFFASATYKGCTTDTQSFFARVEPLPIVNIVIREVSVCLKEPVLIKVDAVKPYWFGNYTYDWSPGIALDDSTVREPHFFSQELKTYDYVLKVSTPLGCSGADAITIHARPPLLTLSASPYDTTIMYGDEIRIFAMGAKSYQWDPLNNVSDGLLPAPYVRPLSSTVYTVTGFNEYGCSDTRAVRITVDPSMHDDIPSAFTPNGDGRNDYFNVVSLKYRNLQEFRVFDRWGTEVFSTNSPKPGWDGKYKGEPCPVGVYFYIIRVSRPVGGSYMYKGEVTLIR